ncbi:MAG: response regulator [Isosphaeraceae bacterium]
MFLARTTSDGSLETIKILLADDHPLVLLGVRHTLEQDGGFLVVGEARSGHDLVRLVGEHAPEVVLLDPKMPAMDGISALDQIRHRFPNVKVVLFSAAADIGQVEAAFRHGASGYVVKTIDTRDLGPAIRQAIQGTDYHAIGIPALTGESAATAFGLSERELEVVRAAAGGLSNREIATKLFVTEQTVKLHLTNIYRKLGIPNRTGLTRWVLNKGLQK